MEVVHNSLLVRLFLSVRHSRRDRDKRGLHLMNEALAKLLGPVPHKIHLAAKGDDGSCIPWALNGCWHVQKRRARATGCERRSCRLKSAPGHKTSWFEMEACMFFVYLSACFSA